MLYDRNIRIRDRECFDGGFADPLPIQNAIDAGCTDVLVILTRRPGYVEPAPGLLTRRLFVRKCARGNERLIEAGLRLHMFANAARDLALGRRSPPASVNIATICPADRDPAVARTTKDARAKALSLLGARKAVRAFGGDADRLVEVLRYFPNACLAERALKLEEPLLAHDIVTAGLERHTADVRLRQLLGLALARSGSTARAKAVLEALERDGVVSESSSRAQAA